MSKTRRVLTTEFKQECVNLVVNQGYTMSQAASTMQVGLSSMQHWTTQYKHELLGVMPQARAFTPEQRRIQLLEAENRQLKRDNDLLKKASACLSPSKCKRATSRRVQAEEG